MTVKPKVTAHKYERRGSPLLIDPKAYLETFFFFDDCARENVELGDAVIVDIREPLEQHTHSWLDSYEDILQRVDLACATSARAVILRFDSPGGEAAGCFDAARAVRAKCDAAGKPLYGYVEGDCCSAAYAFAAVCEYLVVGDTSLTGSIGVVMSRDDWSARNAAEGIRVAFVTSGARKADGHPDNPITDAELAAAQSIIDELAGVFFDFIYETRGLATQTVAQFEARYFAAQTAVSVGLADEVGSLSTVLAKIAGGVEGTQTMANPYEKARAALEEAAKGTDANAAAAKAALAAMDAASGGGGDGDGDGDGDKPADDDKKKDDGAGPATGDPPPADDDKKAAAAAASAYREAIAARKEATAARAELAKMREETERTNLIASRPSMPAEMVALLKKAPIELVRETVKDMPDSPLNPQLAADPKRGDAQSQLGLDPVAKRKLDERMGIVPRTPGDESTDTKLVLGGRRPQASTAPAPVVPPGKTN